MPHPRPLGGAGLGGADVHVCVDLARVHRQHGQVKGLGDGDGQVGFAAGGGPQQHDHPGGITPEAGIRLGSAGFGAEGGSHRPSLPGAGTGAGLHPWRKKLSRGPQEPLHCSDGRLNLIGRPPLAFRAPPAPYERLQQGSVRLRRRADPGAGRPGAGAQAAGHVHRHDRPARFASPRL